MRNSSNKIHTKLTGDVAKASQWVPFARNILDGLIDSSGTGSTYTSKTLQPEDGTRIIVRLAGAERFIHIHVTPPCTDRQGFLLTRSNNYGEQTYTANYVDGYSERINPITGTPRPDPDPADRTKNQKVAPDLFLGAFYGKTPAKFTGLMRKVVGCYHLRGLNAPFNYTWGTTHGIVKRTTKVNNVDVTKHWIVEISSLGVWAAPISETGKCCDSWDVSMYQPTAKELEENPGWQTYKTTLSLWWAAVYGKRPGVHNAWGNMTEPYGQGSPWFTDHGWAFSASGNECRAVTQRKETVPDDHFKCNQWKIVFTDDGQGELVASLENVDQDQVYIPLLDSPLWVPDSPGVWSGVDSYLPTGTETSFFPGTDAPLHVFFDGENAVVTRAAFSRATIPAFQTPPVPVAGGTINYDSLRAGRIPDTEKPQFSCYSSSAAWNSDFDLIQGGVGENNPSYTEVVAGFYNEKQNRVFTRYGRTVERYVTYEAYTYDTDQEFGNTYGLHPDCYFIRTPPGSLITVCSSTFHYHDHFGVYVQDKYSTFDGRGAHPSLIMLAEDRESVLMVWDEIITSQGTVVRQNAKGAMRITQREYKVDSGDCPLTDNTWRDGASGGGVANVGPAYSDIVDDESHSGGVQLDIGSKSYTYEPSIGGPPFYTWDTYDFQTFLERTAQKTTAVSNVFAIHGNLYYDEEGLNPTNQRDNAVIWLGPPSSFAIGGFEPTGEKISFVGRS